MEDDLADIIRKARVPWTPDENDGKSSFSMPESGHTSFDSSFSMESKRRKGGRGFATVVSPKRAQRDSELVAAFQWSEVYLRIEGSIRDRVVMAIRDAARVLERKGGNPYETEFYVGTTIANGWNLKPRDLSVALKKLAEMGFIAIEQSRKGKHVRMILIGKFPS